MLVYIVMSSKAILSQRNIYLVKNLLILDTGKYRKSSKVSAIFFNFSLFGQTIF